MFSSKHSVALPLYQRQPCLRRRLFFHRAFSQSSCSLNANTTTRGGNPSHRASDKLFADAAREEEVVVESSSGNPSTRFDDTNDVIWDGEERVQDTVLRMLMDKYKPHRSGTIRSADEKIKDVASKLVSSAGYTHSHPHPRSRPHEDIDVDDASTSPPPPVLKPTSGSWATEPLLKSTEGHKPWHTVFKTPSHVTSSIKLGQLPPPPPPTLHASPSSSSSSLFSASASTSNGKPNSTSSTALGLGMDPNIRKMEREERKRSAHIGRLTKAREGTLDYRLGVKSSDAGGGFGGGMRSGPGPVSMKGWQSLVEERIEKARLAGAFQAVKGRGEPIKRVVEEYNPFIGREEFLMNRIVQRNGAAPAWVEIQVELESASQSFRDTLRRTWIQRAIRMTCAINPPELLRSYTSTDVKSMRDQEWEQRERGYHEAAVAQLNGLVRKYNAQAPFVARRPYYMLKVELERMYEDCVDEILSGLIDASKRGRGTTSDSASAHGHGHGGGNTSPRNAAGDVDNKSRVGVGGDNEVVSSWVRYIVEWMGRIISGWRSR